jgi:hypothetical protein
MVFWNPSSVQLETFYQPSPMTGWRSPRTRGSFSTLWLFLLSRARIVVLGNTLCHPTDVLAAMTRVNCGLGALCTCTTVVSDSRLCAHCKPCDYTTCTYQGTTWDQSRALL